MAQGQISHILLSSKMSKWNFEHHSFCHSIGIQQSLFTSVELNLNIDLGICCWSCVSRFMMDSDLGSAMQSQDASSLLPIKEYIMRVCPSLLDLDEQDLVGLNECLGNSETNDSLGRFVLNADFTIVFILFDQNEQQRKGLFRMNSHIFSSTYWYLMLFHAMLDLYGGCCMNFLFNGSYHQLGSESLLNHSRDCQEYSPGENTKCSNI